MQVNIGSFLTKRAHLCPSLEAVVEVERGRRFSFAQLNARANRVAHFLLSKGLAPGDRIALLLKNGVECVEAYFGAAKMGAIVVPLNWRLVSAELEFILKDSGASALIYDSEFRASVESLPERETLVRTWIQAGATGTLSPGAQGYDALLQEASEEEPRLASAGDDPLFIMYTSGTTGYPKGAVHTHNSMLWASLTVNTTCDIRYQDRDLVVLPLFHIGALLPLTVVFHRGGTAVVMRSFSAERVPQVIQEERITTMWTVSTALQFMLSHFERRQTTYPTLRWVVGGGEPVPVWLIERYASLGIAVIQDYGLTECGPATISSPEEARHKPASAGKAYFHTEVRVVDDAGHDLPPGHRGQILVRGPHLMQAYWNRPQDTARSLRHGWLCTGDLGSLDADGCLYLQGRKTDMIISGGENIYPAELENLLLAHPQIKEAAVIGQPSAKWGESPAAIVVLKDGATVSAEEVMTYCRGKVAAYKIPRVVEFVEEIPRTPTGKAQKHLLRARFPGPAPQ